MRPYILTAGAAADVQEIARYTQKKWGAASITAIGPGAALLHCGSGALAAIFGWWNAPALILAILIDNPCHQAA